MTFSQSPSLKIRKIITQLSKFLQEIFGENLCLFFQHGETKKWTYPDHHHFLVTESLPQTLQKSIPTDWTDFHFLAKKDKKKWDNYNQSKFLKKMNKQTLRHTFFLAPYQGVEEDKQVSSEPYFFEDFSYAIKIRLKNDKIKCTVSGPKNNQNLLKYLRKKIRAILNNQEKKNLETHKWPLFQWKISSNLASSLKTLKNELIAGNCYLANFTQTLFFQNELFPSLELFLTRWFEKQTQFGVYFQNKPYGLASFSPERFLLTSNNYILSQPIKGTHLIEENEPLKKSIAKLWKNKKEIYENTMITDLIRNDFNSFCSPNSVKVYKPFEIFKSGKLLQMQTTVVGKKPKHIGWGKVFSYLLPGGSVTGTPKKNVCQFIRTQEEHARGFYTGVAGIIDAKGNINSCLLIRSLFQSPRGVYAGVGAGITTLSNIKKETLEFKNKLKSFLDA